MFAERMRRLQQELAEAGIDVALITDDDNVYYLTGYYDYLHMEFGRPTILVVPKDGATLLITPVIDVNTAQASARVGRIVAWNDGMGDEWREELPAAVRTAGCIAIEPDHMPPLVRSYMDELVGRQQLVSVTPILSGMRMIKSAEELQLARHAGQVAMAMMEAGRAAIGDGVPNTRWRLRPPRPEHARRPRCWRRTTMMKTCRPIRISCRSWLPATRSPEPITGPPPVSCGAANRFSFAFAA